jgi:hypothetical protein
VASNITDLLDRVTDSSSSRPVISVLASPGKAIGASSINLSDVTNWTTASAVHLSIYTTQVVAGVTIKDTSSQTDFKGTLAGTTISNLTLTGGVDRAYTAGAIVELTPTSRYAKDLYDWGTTEHKQTGAHSNITADSVTNNGNYSQASGTFSIPVGALSTRSLTIPAAFRAYANGNQTGIADSVWTTIVLGTEDYDTGNNFASNTFTAPVAGRYHFDAQIATIGTAGLVQGLGIRLLKNGTTSISGAPSDYDNNVSYDFMFKNLSDTVNLNASDTIVLQGLLRLSGGTAGFAGDTTSITRLAGYLVSAT